MDFWSTSAGQRTGSAASSTTSPAAYSTREDSDPSSTHLCEEPLLPGMTVESMWRASRLRNLILARIFREAGIMEQWGAGIQRVYQQVAEAGLPEPVIEEVMDRVRVTIFADDHHPGVLGRRHDAYGHGDAGRHVGRYDVVMLRAAESAPVHRDQLLAAAGLKPLSQNYTRHVALLVEKGLLEMTRPDKPRSRAQRYRITELGRALLAGQEMHD